MKKTNANSSDPILYLIRHGETDWNQTGLLQGHTDIPLNQAGRSQAEVLRPFLLELPIREAISSDLSRAVETARIALPHFTPRLDPRLREAHLGRAEGTDRNLMRSSFGDELIDRWISPKPEDFHARFPEGESRREAVDRLKVALQEILTNSSGPVACFTHGLVMRSFAQEVTGTNSEHLRAPNCSVFEFSWSGVFKLRQIYWP